MTDNENVASNEEATNEPVPNPYNMRKSWHTEEVMPTANVDSANSLFVEPRTPVQKTESEEPQETQQQASKDKAYKKPDYKKRYDDLKRHYDSKLNEFRSREQELIQEATNKVESGELRPRPRTDRRHHRHHDERREHRHRSHRRHREHVPPGGYPDQYDRVGMTHHRRRDPHDSSHLYRGIH